MFLKVKQPRQNAKYIPTNSCSSILNSSGDVTRRQTTLLRSPPNQYILGKPVSFVCRDAIWVMEKANLLRHCISELAKLNELSEQMGQDKSNDLRQSLASQQATFTRPRDNDKIIQASYAVSQLTALKLRSHVQGEFVKECRAVSARIIKIVLAS